MATNVIKGGEFLVKKTTPEAIFTPEEWQEEALMIAGMCDEFISKEIHPILDRIDAMEPGLMVSL